MELCPEAIHHTVGLVRSGQSAAYFGVMPAAQHKALTQPTRQTNHLKRFSNTLRARVSRLGRSTRPFAKPVENPIGAIRSFLGHSNLTRAA